MNKTIKTATFATTIGMILATAGSAVGLGNIWRFPTMTGENGGAAFIFIYMIFNVVIGLVGMMAEFIVGRSGGANSVTAYAKAGRELADGKVRKYGELWGIFGALGGLGTALILSFYSVIAGWCVYYLYKALKGEVLGSPEEIEATFGALVSTDYSWICCLLAILFTASTYFIVARGIEKGIEKASKLMVPLLFILLIILSVASCMLPGAGKGLEFLLMPDISKVTWKTVYEAMSHSFFSLSLGIACLCTYASYMKKDINLAKAAVQIACIDIGVAIIAGFMIFPAAFSVGVSPDSGPSLIFLTLPNVFTNAFPSTIGYCIAVLFYFLLVLAALTSTISMLEVGTVVIEQKLRLSRSVAAAIVTLFCCVMGSLCSLSFAYPEIGLAGTTFFDNCDYITAKFMLPIGGFFTAILVGWLMPKEKVINELASHGTVNVKPLHVNIFFFLLRFVCPICVAVIFIGQLI